MDAQIKMEIITFNRNIWNQIPTKWGFSQVESSMVKVHGWIMGKEQKEFLCSIGSIWFRVGIVSLRNYFNTNDGVVVCLVKFGGRFVEEIVPHIYLK